MKLVKTMVRGLAALAVAVALTAPMFGCGFSQPVSNDELVGEWSGSWEYEGRQVSSDIQFDRDGTFVQVVYSNNRISSTTSGSYVIEKDTVKLVEMFDSNGEPGVWVELEYDKGLLVDKADHVFSKEG